MSELQLFQLEPNVEKESAMPADYQPISSVWEGNDTDLIETMLKFYASIPPEPILDATYNKGRF